MGATQYLEGQGHEASAMRTGRASTAEPGGVVAAAAAGSGGGRGSNHAGCSPLGVSVPLDHTVARAPV